MALKFMEFASEQSRSMVIPGSGYSTESTAFSASRSGLLNIEAARQSCLNGKYNKALVNREFAK